MSDVWGRDMADSFMMKDLARSGLVPEDFPYGVEQLPPNDEGQDRYKINITSDYWKVRVNRKENKYYGPKGVVPPIATLGNFEDAQVIATVEGYKKGLLFHITTGIPTIILDGCWMFGELVDENQITSVKNLASTIIGCLTPGQDHLILFDGDWATNENVQRAMSTYRILLEEQNAQTYFKDLSYGPERERYGYDDWFVATYRKDRREWPDKDDLLLSLVRDVPNVNGKYLLGGALSFMLANFDRFSSEYLDLNDRGAGSLLIKLIGANNLKYLKDTSEWLRWDADKWVNAGKTPIKLVNLVSRYYFERANILEAHAKKYTDNPEKVEIYLKQVSAYRHFASTSCSNTPSRKNILSDLILSERNEIYAKSSDFDANPYLLGVQNGVLDIRTGELRPETQEDLITRHCNVPYIENPSPIVEGGRNVDDFLRITFGVAHGELDPVFYEYMQRRLGVALHGGNKLQSFEVWQGEGSDGKSSLALMLQGVLGDSSEGGYSAATKPEIIMNGFSRGSNPEGATPFLVMLRGARMVFASETTDNASLNEALIKQLTGGERIQARGNYQDGGSFKVDFTLFLTTNPMPQCRNLDSAMLRRLAIMPYKVRWQTKAAPSDFDKHLPIGDEWWVESAAQSKEVRQYILWWMVQGCVKYYAEGRSLGEVPERCKQAIDVYREEADTVAIWMGECGVGLKNGTYTSLTDLYNSYKAYAENSGYYVPSNRTFCARLLTKGNHEVKLTKGKVGANRIVIFGVCFNN